MSGASENGVKQTYENGVKQTYSWKEVKKHCTAQDAWIVIHGKVYNVTNWLRKHPGGKTILVHVAGQDASEQWTAMHKDKDYVANYMKPLLVGEIEQTNKDIIRDFRELHQEVEDAGLFDSHPLFYVLHFGHIIMLEILAYWILSYFGVGWLPYLLAVGLMTTMQAQCGWSQHDYGHRSVFKSTTWNWIVHQIIIGHLMGASSKWWDTVHSLHHSKVGVHKKDPDITLQSLFVVGDKIPVKYGKEKKKVLPYQHQHYYFVMGLIPLLGTVLYNIETVRFIMKGKLYWDLTGVVSYMTRHLFMYTPLLGLWGAIKLFLLVRIMYGFWFVFVTSMSHIPMETDVEKELDWVTSAALSTCNVESSAFNDWFSGHLNFQIEHHLFPSMPRHNLHKIEPKVRALMRKHNLPYVVKPIGTAMLDVVRSLRISGQLWYEAYYGEDEHPLKIE